MMDSMRILHVAVQQAGPDGNIEELALSSPDMYSSMNYLSHKGF